MRIREVLLDVVWLIVIVMLLPVAIPLAVVAVAVLFVQRMVLWPRSVA